MAPVPALSLNAGFSKKLLRNCFAKVRIYRIVGGQHPAPGAMCTHPIPAPPVAALRAAGAALGRAAPSLAQASPLRQNMPTPEADANHRRGRGSARAPLAPPAAAAGRSRSRAHSLQVLPTQMQGVSPRCGGAAPWPCRRVNPAPCPRYQNNEVGRCAAAAFVV